jgi:hypothetical protein
MRALPRTEGGWLSGIVRKLGPPAVLFGITVVMFWKIALTSQYTWLNAPDYANQVLPWLQFQAREWHAGRFPLWDPYHWAGQPLVGQMQPGAVYPLNWLLFLMPLKNGFLSTTLLNWYQVLIHFMAALACYGLARDLKRSRLAAVLAGTIFGMSGFVGTTEWPQMVNGAVWTPLVLMFFLRVQRGEKPLVNSALSGACLGVSFLSGHHQIPLFMGLFMAGLWLWMGISRTFGVRQYCVFLALFGLLCALCSAAQLLPAQQFGEIALRWVGAKSPVGWNDAVPYTVHSQYSMNPVSILGLIVPWIITAANPFLGMTGLTLAIAGLVAFWKERQVQLLTGAAIGGLVFSLGSASSFHGFLYAVVPGLEKARNPSVAIFSFTLCAAVLAAYGIDAIRSCPQEVKILQSLSLVAFGLGIAAFLIVFCVYTFVEGRAFLQSRTAGAALGALLLAAVLECARRGALDGRSAAYLLLGLVMFDLSSVVGYVYASREQGWDIVDKLYANNDIVDYLRSQPGLPRVGVDTQEIPYNMGDLFGIQQIEGYSGITTNMVRANGMTQMRDLLGESFYVGRKPARANQEPVFTGHSGLIVFRNSETGPRVWITHQIVNVANEAELLAALQHPAAELRARAVLWTQGAVDIEHCENSDVARVTRYGQSSISIEAEMSCPGLLILADTYAPGWRAEVDRSPTRILEAYGVIRGLRVPAGHHRVEFSYRPRSVLYGGAMTLLGFLLLPVVALCEPSLTRQLFRPAGGGRTQDMAT